MRSNQFTWFGVPEHNWQSLQCLDVSTNIGQAFMYSVVPENIGHLARLRHLNLALTQIHPQGTDLNFGSKTGASPLNIAGSAGGSMIARNAE